MKVKRCKRIYCTNNSQKRTGMATLISSKMDFKTKILTRRTFYNNKRMNRSIRYDNCNATSKYVK